MSCWNSAELDISAPSKSKILTSRLDTILVILGTRCGAPNGGATSSGCGDAPNFSRRKNRQNQACIFSPLLLLFLLSGFRLFTPASADRRKLGGKGLQEPPWDGSSPSSIPSPCLLLGQKLVSPLKQNLARISGQVTVFLHGRYLLISLILDAAAFGALVLETVPLLGLHGSWREPTRPTHPSPLRHAKPTPPCPTSPHGHILDN